MAKRNTLPLSNEVHVAKECVRGQRLVPLLLVAVACGAFLPAYVVHRRQQGGGGAAGVGAPPSTTNGRVPTRTQKINLNPRRDFGTNDDDDRIRSSGRSLRRVAGPPSNWRHRIQSGDSEGHDPGGVASASEWEGTNLTFEHGTDAATSVKCDAQCCLSMAAAASTSTGADGAPPRRPRRLQDEGMGLSVGASVAISAVLVAFSALFSGLTLGLMALDKNGLEIVMAGDDPVAAKNARKIYPVRKNGNLLLCTLLLGNVAVNALLSIVMADIAGGVVGFVVSTALLVVFGEIIPQAVCSRYALAIGSRVVPLVKVIIVILFPIAFPLSWCLNKMLGHELGTIYSKAEMRKLLEIHAERGGFDKDMASAMTGALKYQDVRVSEVMTTMDKTYMLSVDEKLSYETIVAVFKTGYSRVPVYEGKNRNNVIGLLFVKDLIFVDPEEETPLRSFVRIFSRGLHVVWPDDSLGDVLRELKQGRSHMALVRDVNNSVPDQDPFYEIKGIITLEDIIEVILGDEIVDETDNISESNPEKSSGRRDFDWDRLRLLDTKLVDKRLTPNEEKAVYAFLRANYDDTLSLLTDRQLEDMIASTCVTEIEPPPPDDQEAGPDDGTGDDETLYERGVETDSCTLILSGKVTVMAGKDGFQSDSGAWSVLATDALTESGYAPDFTAYVAPTSGPCRCLRFTRDRFTAAVDASTAERITVERKEPPHPGNEGEEALHQRTPSLAATGADDHAGTHAAVSQRKSRRSKLLAAFHSKISQAGHNHASGGSSAEEVLPPTDTLSDSSEKPEESGSLQMKLTKGGSYAPRSRTPKSQNMCDDDAERKATSIECNGGQGTVEFMDYSEPIPEVRDEDDHDG